MQKLILVFCFIVLKLTVHSQEKIPYVIFNSKGKKVSYKKMFHAAQQSDITFFGEYHNNPIAHWLQLELTHDVAAFKNNQLTLGFEMFETDQQAIINAYLSGKIDDRKFIDTMRMWSNYKTDYKPLVEFAKEHAIACIATNIPRRIASLTFKKGRAILDSLDQQDYAFMCDKNFPVDYELSQYKAILQMSTDHEKGKNFINAQAIKDATMARFIQGLWTLNTTFIHFNGAYHTDFDQGIIWYLKKLRPDVNYTTITTIEQENLKKLEKEHIGRAHFIICVNPKMTKTH